MRGDEVMARYAELHRGWLFDGVVQLLDRPHGKVAAGVFGHTGQVAIFTDLLDDWIERQLTAANEDLLMAPTSPAFIGNVARALGVRDDGVDVLLAASRLPGEPELVPVPFEGRSSRVLRGTSYRRDVRLFESTDGAVQLCLGRGFGGRLEVSVDVEPAHQGAGRGRWAAAESRKLAPAGETVFAQVAPANAASLRAFLAAGFEVVGSEILFWAAAG